MARGITVFPPDEFDTDQSVIFLAGPIQNGPDWQLLAANIIHALDSGIVVANPRRDYLGDSFVYEAQVDWETKALRMAELSGAVLFWLAPQETPNPERAYAQTTRFEIGEWKTRAELLGSPVVVGFGGGFSNSRYIRRRFSQDCSRVRLCEGLQATCEQAVILARATQAKR